MGRTLLTAAPAAPEAPEPAPAAPPPLEEPASKATAAKPGSKTAQVLGLLRREQGATLEELVKATGWLPHTTRAALTGLRHKGHVIDKSKRDEATCYTIRAAA